MTAQIKYLSFKGITKREEILFKSFLNLAKNELTYQVVVLTANGSDQGDPDIIILSDAYELKETEQNLLGLPSIIVGDDDSKRAARYLTRPVKWSEFKQALTEVNVALAEDNQILPQITSLLLNEIGEKPEIGSQSVDNSEKIEPKSADKGDYQLDNMHVDYQSFTPGDHIKVVHDLTQIKPDDSELMEQKAVILLSDDESGYENSVLVIETNSVDAWDFSRTESVVRQINNEFADEVEEPELEDVVLVQRVGFEVKPGEEYWLEDNEIIIDNQSILFIKPAREMVYSDLEPGKWPALLKRRALFKAPLPDDWQPQPGMGVYPMRSLLWVNSLIDDTEALAPELDEDAEYILEKWPNFDLLELDNVLLKLCTMLFVRPESVDSLAIKSRYARSTIRGLMNACYEMGCLTTPEQLNLNSPAHASNEVSLLGKIKDVFR